MERVHAASPSDRPDFHCFAGFASGFLYPANPTDLRLQIHRQMVAYAACRERATFKTEFFPPKGLGTDSAASGSVIQCPSTTKQYS